MRKNNHLCLMVTWLIWLDPDKGGKVPVSTPLFQKRFSVCWIFYIKFVKYDSGQFFFVQTLQIFWLLSEVKKYLFFVFKDAKLRGSFLEKWYFFPILHRGCKFLCVIRLNICFRTNRNFKAFSTIVNLEILFDIGKYGK